MSDVQVLSIGSNPNLIYYSWRLVEAKSSVELTIVNPSITTPILWSSSHFNANLSFQPHHHYKSVSQIPQSSYKYDIVLLSSNSLQDFQSITNDLLPYINEDTVLLIESTGYINLEPFIKLSLPQSLQSSVVIMSIMNESDVKQISSSKFNHTVRNNDTRIYFGNSSISNTSSDLYKSSINYQRMYVLLHAVQQDSNNAISLLKSLNNKEFMTYQWKLALPRIVFNPLTVLFESPYPSSLHQQILCQPLIKGIINELFKIIKKMDCKLVKGFENETNLLNHWSNYYPQPKVEDSYLQTNALFYNFYNQLNEFLEIDLLLLQPILLGDDHGIKTPYLENLYSIMCQYVKINSKQSIFFTRGNGSNTNHATKELDIKQKKINELEMKSIDLSNSINKSEKYHQDLSYKVQSHESNLRTLQDKITNYQLSLDKLEQDYASKSKSLQDNYSQFESDLKQRQLSTQQELDLKRQQVEQEIEKKRSSFNEQQQQQEAAAAAAAAQKAVAAAPPPQVNGSRNVRDSVQPGDNLADLTHIALYGAAINGEQAPTQESSQSAAPQESTNISNGDVPNHIYQKELELQKREQALLAREMQATANPVNDSYQSHPPQQSYSEQGYTSQPQYQKPYYGPPSQQQYYNNNGYFNQGFHPQPSPLDQQPPHGLPSQGLPQNGLPPNLRASNSMVSNVNRYQHPQQQQGPPPNGYPVRRVGSIPNAVNTYNEYPPQTQPYGQNPPQQQYVMPAHNGPNYANAAPIDSFVEGRFKANPKKSNRRSAFPGALEGLDMGPRGGMPGGVPNHQKHRSMGPMNSLQVPPQSQQQQQQQQRKSVSNPLNGQFTNLNLNTSGGPPQSQSQSQPQAQSQAQPQSQNGSYNGSTNYLQPPILASNTSSQSSTNTYDTPKTSSSNESGDHVQVNGSSTQSNGELIGKPLGGISDSNRGSGLEHKKKKKSGLFGKKK